MIKLFFHCLFRFHRLGSAEIEGKWIVCHWCATCCPECAKDLGVK